MLLYIFVDCRNGFAIKKITMPKASTKPAKIDQIVTTVYVILSVRKHSVQTVSLKAMLIYIFDHCMMCIINNIFMSLLYQEFTSQRYKPVPAVILINTCHAEYFYVFDTFPIIIL